MSVVAIIQARMTSSRLPGKVLKTICGKPLLQLQIERVIRAKLVQRVIVATSTDASDDRLETLCDEIGLSCFRGSLDDVLGRFHAAANLFQTTHAVRLTGDCPLADPTLIDAIVARHIAESADYTSNTLEPTFPDGLDVEVVKVSALDRAQLEAKLPSEREHVTPFFYKHPEFFRLHSFKGEVDRSGMRWVVDEPDDFAFISRVFESLYPVNPEFRTEDVLALQLSMPDLVEINGRFRRNEGYEKSLAKDGEKACRPDTNNPKNF